MTLSSAQTISATGTGMPVSREFHLTSDGLSGQTITFSAPGNVTFGVAPLTLAATASSGLPVTFTSTTPSVCTVSGSTAVIMGAGTCSITATQPGNGSYSAAPPVTQSFLINKASQAITFTSLFSITFSPTPFTISAQASSGLPVTFVSTTTGVCTVAGTTVTLVATGICSIKATQGGNANYTAAPPVTQKFTISPAPQTISVTGISSATVPASSFTITATATSGLPVSFSSDTPSICNVSGSTVVPVAAGVCTITAYQWGNGNYDGAHSVNVSFTINHAQAGSAGWIIGGAPLAITTPSILPSGSIAAGYSQQLQASGGVAPYSWSLVQGALPTGVSLDSTGWLHGIPAASGQFTFTVKVTGADGSNSSIALSLAISGTLILPHFAAGGSYTTVVCVSNSANRVAQVDLAFRDDNGSPVALVIKGTGRATNLSSTVAPAGVRCFEASDPQGPTVSGSVLLTADPGIAIQALFRNHAPDGYYYEASVPATSGGSEFVMPFDATVFPATGAQIFTGVAIANADSTTSAKITCTARDSEGNVILGAVSVPVLNPGGHWADFRFPALQGLRGTLDCASNTAIGVLGLRFLGYDAFSSLPAIVPGSGPATGIPHFAAGGSYITGFFVVNSSGVPAHFSIVFHDDSGAPAPLVVSGPGATSTLADAVPAHGLRYYEASSASGALIAGSASISADPGIAVQALFRNHALDGNYYEAAVPSSSGGNELAMPFDATTFSGTGDAVVTGIAIENLDSSRPAGISCSATDSSGNLIFNAITVPTLSPGGHWADYRFPALTGKQGTIDCISTTRVGALGLRFLGVNAFSSLPVTIK